MAYWCSTWLFYGWPISGNVGAITKHMQTKKVIEPTFLHQIKRWFGILFGLSAQVNKAFIFEINTNLKKIIRKCLNWPMYIVSEWLLFNAKWGMFHLDHGDPRKISYFKNNHNNIFHVIIDKFRHTTMECKHEITNQLSYGI